MINTYQCVQCGWIHNLDDPCPIPEIERLREVEKRLTRAIEVLYHGSPELQQVAENAFSGCASTQRENPCELKEYLEKNS